MTKEKELPVKYYEFFCKDCKHEWLSKKDDHECPKCKSTLLEYQKLR